MIKLTENEVVLILKTYLEEKGWEIGENYCLGQNHGYDIQGNKGNQQIIIEVKGARASDESPTKRRKVFDSGQIKTHFGKAIVKTLETRLLCPNAILGIAHPDDPDIRKAIGSITPLLKELKITHFWVSKEKVSQE